MDNNLLIQVVVLGVVIVVISLLIKLEHYLYKYSRMKQINKLNNSLRSN